MSDPQTAWAVSASNLPAYDPGKLGELTMTPRGELRVAMTDSTGAPVTAQPAGRAPAVSSSPVVVSNEDQANMKQTYRRAAAVGATAGDAVLVSGVTTAGTVTLTLVNGGAVVLSVPIGSSVLPFGATAAALTSAVGGTFQSLFYT